MVDILLSQAANGLVLGFLYVPITVVLSPVLVGVVGVIVAFLLIRRLYGKELW